MCNSGTAGIVTTALRGTLADSVQAAALEAAPQLERGSPFHLELDVAVGEEVYWPVGPGSERAREGLDAIALAPDVGHVGAVLPTELVVDQDFTAGPRPALDLTRLREVMQRRTGMAGDAWTEGAPYRVAVEAYAEGGAGRPAERLVRGWPERREHVEAEDLRMAVRAGADYLARSVRDDGSFVYRYHPIDERPDEGYALLRHAGATYALLEVYDELREPAYLEAAGRAIGLLSNALTRVSGARPSMTYLSGGGSSEQQRSGGSGLALVALAMHARVTGSRAHLDTMRSLARFLVSQQYPDGHFRDNDDVLREHPGPAAPRKKEVIYYAGEAILGLLRLHALDPDPAWLAAAQKGVRFCVAVRDAGRTEDDLEHDHWLSYAIDDIERVAPSPAHADHAFAIARAIAAEQRRAHDGPPDLIGSFHDGNACATAVRVEAYAADIQLARFLGQPDGWLLDAASEAASFTLAQQYGARNDFFVKDPARARGGVRESPFGTDVRIDYVQHAVSGWLHLARALREPVGNR